MKLTADGKDYIFAKAPLRFIAVGLTDAFANKNNKTLDQTIEHHRYRALAGEVRTKYGDELHVGLGHFVLSLKASGDQFYRRFLNKYGDSKYCHFELADKEFARKRGLYAYTLAESLKYIGRCKDSFAKRINQGYGKIHPKNCYRDGQATNCHLNALIAEHPADLVSFWIHPMLEADEIERVERRLIAAYRPSWNIQLSESDQ